GHTPRATKRQIDAYRAQLIVERTRCLPDPERRREVEATALAHTDKTAPQLDRLLRRAVITADPTGAEHRAYATKQHRICRPHPSAPTATMSALLTIHGPAEELTA